MKKTLITLLALAGVVCAEESSFSMSVANNATWTEGVTFTQSEDDILSLTYISTTASNVNTTYYSNPPQEGTYTNGTYEETFTKKDVDFYSPKVQFVNLYSGRYWTLNFSIENTSSSDITLNALTLTLQGVTADGLTWTSTSYGLGNYALSVLDANGQVLGTNTVEIGTDGSSVSSTINFTDSVRLNQGPLNLSLQVKDIESAMTGFVALTGGSIDYAVAPIPEPATATLSLLAMAGLAARRRRK